MWNVQIDSLHIVTRQLKRYSFFALNKSKKRFEDVTLFELCARVY